MNRRYRIFWCVVGTALALGVALPDQGLAKVSETKSANANNGGAPAKANPSKASKPDAGKPGAGKPAAGKASASEPDFPKGGKGLHRADFRVEGASCVACLRRVAKKFQDKKGVLKADVSIYRPYWAIVIYDSAKVNLKQILDSALDEKVSYAEIHDEPVAEMPIVLLPRRSDPR